MTKVLSPSFTILDRVTRMPALPTISRPGSSTSDTPSRRDVLLDDRRIGHRVGRRVFVEMVGNAEPAADIDMADIVAGGLQLAHQIGQQRKGVVERRHVGDLAADMHVDADRRDARQRGDAGIDLAGPAR